MKRKNILICSELGTRRAKLSKDITKIEANKKLQNKRR